MRDINRTRLLSIRPCAVLECHRGARTDSTNPRDTKLAMNSYITSVRD
jgi:hypothetical protein